MTMLRNLKRRNTDVKQQQMSFLEEPPPAGVAPVWAALDEQQRAEVVGTLARLIAKVVAGQSAPLAVESEEQANE